MKALQLTAVQKVELVDAQVPSPADDQLLVRTGAAVICTSDLNDIRSNPFGLDLPKVLGHEAAGVVARAGKSAAGFQPGDRVATHPVHPCGHCGTCRRGLGHLCPSMGHFGVNMPGTFAEYYLVRADRARRVPDSMSFALAALAEPVCVCLEALAQAQVEPGQSLLILGDGPFGVLMSRLARGLRLGKLVVAGRQDFRLAFARPAVTINTQGKDDPSALLKEQTGGEGFDAAILAVGSAEAARQGLALLRPKGRLVIFSPVHGGDTPLDLPAVLLRELEIRGACNDQNRFDQAMACLADPALAIEQIITHRLPLESFSDGLRLARDCPDQAMKVAFTF